MGKAFAKLKHTLKEYGHQQMQCWQITPKQNIPKHNLNLIAFAEAESEEKKEHRPSIFHAWQIQFNAVMILFRGFFLLFLIISYRKHVRLVRV